MGYQGKLTIKGQVTVPLAMRRALGLEPGDSVRWDIDDAGVLRLTKADVDEEKLRRRAEFQARIRKAGEIFRRSDTMPGISTDDFMDLIREPLQPFEIEPKR